MEKTGMLKCNTCKYRTFLYGAKSMDNNSHTVGCGYMMITGKRRGCDPEDCDKYDKGKALRIKDPTCWAKG